jgi:hypothetical protein
MKLVGLLALAACTAGQAAPPAGRPVEVAAPLPPAVPAASIAGVAPAVPTVTAAPSCVDDVMPFETKVLGTRLAFLASDKLGGRVPGTDGDRAARAHIVDRFTCLGLTPAGDEGTYEQAFEVSGQATANVLGFIPGTDPTVGSEIIVVSAHHDHLGDGHLGANDNASGVTALLAIAQAMKQKDAAPKRTIAFMAFGAEEQGMVGSVFYVKHPAAALPNAKVVQVINLDMVGSHRSKGFVAAMGTFEGMPSRKLLGSLAKSYPRIHVGMGGRARGSDYEPFCDIGIPYVFFWTPDARCYHARCDTADKIDLPHMADIASLAFDLTWGMANGDTDLMASRTKRRCYGK